MKLFDAASLSASWNKQNLCALLNANISVVRVKAPADFSTVIH